MTGPHLIVAVPARDEAARIGAALDTIRAAEQQLRRTRPGATVTVVVAADACRDRTAAVAESAGALVVETTAGRVGAARAAAIRAALTLRPDAVWIANTDADSLVPPGWLVAQADAEEAGVDLLLGTVTPDEREIDPDLLARWARRHRPSAARQHVHGANLGIRTAVYLAAGGFLDVDRDEDVGLTDRVRAAGGRVSVGDREVVVTSARRTGRAPGGFAGYLRALGAATD